MREQQPRSTRTVSRAVTALATAGALVLAGAAPALANSPEGSHIAVVDTGHALRASTHTVHAGQVTFELRSTSPATADGGGADVEVFAPNRGISVASVYAHIRAQQGPQAAASTRWLTKNVAIYGGAQVQGAGRVTATLQLRAGTYTVADLNTVFAGGPVASFRLTVTGVQTVNQMPPRVAATIDLTSKDRFAPTSTTLPAHSAYLVRNVADTVHFVIFTPVKPGTTDADVTKAIASATGPQTGPPPYVLTDKLGVGSGALSPARTEVVSSPLLTPGTYDLECYVADDTTGMPHFFMGLHKIVTIT
jgi:hypothetical protein